VQRLYQSLAQHLQNIKLMCNMGYTNDVLIATQYDHGPHAKVDITPAFWFLQR
jgi:hypothetical protein